MIIVLKDADFSGNNIGQINVPINWDADAQAYVNALSSSTDKQQRLLNTLFIKLKAENLYGKLSKVCLPIFGATDGGRNLLAPSSVTPLPVGATFSEKGMTVSKGFRWNGYPSSNGSIGVYNTEPISSAPQTLSVSIAFNTTEYDSGAVTGRAAGRAIFSSATVSGLNVGATTAERIPLSEVNGVGFIAVSSSSALTISHCLASKSIGTNAFLTPSPTNPILAGTSTTTGQALLAAPIGCIFLGSYLTENELSLLGSIFDNFFDNLYQV